MKSPQNHLWVFHFMFYKIWRYLDLIELWVFYQCSAVSASQRELVFIEIKNPRVFRGVYNPVQSKLYYERVIIFSSRLQTGASACDV